MIDFLQAAQTAAAAAGEAAEATVNNETVSMSMWELFNKGRLADVAAAHSGRSHGVHLR